MYQGKWWPRESSKEFSKLQKVLDKPQTYGINKYIKTRIVFKNQKGIDTMENKKMTKRDYFNVSFC